MRWQRDVSAFNDVSKKPAEGKAAGQMWHLANGFEAQSKALHNNSEIRL